LAGLVLLLPASIRSQERDVLPAPVHAALVKKYGAKGTRYFSNSVDLNGDGRREVVVHIVSQMACGTGGCPTLVFAPTATGYRLLSNITLTRPPISVSGKSANGWKNLIVAISGGGITPGYSELSFNGGKYTGNPTISPAQSAKDLTGATVLIDRFDSFDKAKPLLAVQSNSAAGNSVKTSFDCAKATVPAETLICTDPNLAALDVKLADVFQRGMNQWNADGVAERERTAQRQWLLVRNRCGSSSDASQCVAETYNRRIAEVQIQSGQLVVSQAAGYFCKGSDAVSFQVAFYNDTNPQSAVITLGDKQVLAMAAQAASGARYTAPEVEFWEHHGEATMKWYGKSLTCEVREKP
jgi:uncharacterized protein